MTYFKLKTYRVFVLFLSILLALRLGAQNYSPEEVQEQLEGLSELERVHYINDHFYAIYSADFENAKVLTGWAVKVSKSNNWKMEEGYALMNHGVVLYLMGEYKEALPAYLQSYDLFDSLRHWKGLGMLSTEMANYYHKHKHYKKAFTFLDSAEVFSGRAGDLRTVGKSNGMRATMLFRQGQVEEARPYYEKVHQIYSNLNDSIGLGYTFLDMALYAQRDGDFQKALDFIDESTAIRESINDKQGLAENLYFKGDTYVREQQFKKALSFYVQCANYSKQIGYIDQLRKSYDAIADVSIQLNNYKNAYLYADSSQLLNDSLFNMERAKAIEELQTRYETDKKEQQIEIQNLQLAEQTAEIEKNTFMIGALLLAIVLILVIVWLLRNREQKRQELLLKQKDIQFKEKQLKAVIQSQELERKRFASDLHDGFGQLISILKMNVGAMASEDVQHKQELTQKSTEILNGMYDELRGICFNLMPHTLVNRGLEAAVKELGARINVAGKVSIETDAYGLDHRLSDVYEIAIYRIVQEWINNILKYSEAENITVQLTQDTAELTLTIEDNGVGFDKKLLFQGNGNGWKNISSRANLISAEIDLDTEPGRRNTTFIMNVPIQHFQLNGKPHELTN